MPVNSPHKESVKKVVKTAGDVAETVPACVMDGLGRNSSGRTQRAVTMMKCPSYVDSNNRNDVLLSEHQQKFINCIKSFLSRWR